MFQESTGLSTTPLRIDREFWIGYKLYAGFLLVAFVWTIPRVLKVWYRIPPFVAKSQRPNDPDYLRHLRSAASGIARWIGLVFLAWALLATMAINRFCDVWLGGETMSAAAALTVLGDLSMSLSAALLVVALSHPVALARTHGASKPIMNGLVGSR
ncbi:MAG: hypothetical protein DMG77_11600 [Acidobacteria bacterium]|nr:MAG: hypothetical protein DMG77_11600 [Acidobacteriota bacterium]